MFIRSLGRPLFAGLSPLALFAAPAFASGPVDHFVGITAKRDATVSASPDATAFTLNGLGDDFTFVTGGQFTELPNGSARLIGVLARISDPHKKFLADLTFDNRVDAGNPSFPPAGSPMLDLLAPAYATNGGKVDPAGWHYWLTMTGTLTGLGDYRGAKLLMSKRGPAVQCGNGANGRNCEMGVAGLVTTAVVQQPLTGPALPPSIDGETRMAFAPKFVLGVQEAISDPTVSPYNHTHALQLGPLGTDFVFVAGGQLEEKLDGTAKMTGVIARVSDPHKRFVLDVDFSSRTNSGEAGYAPAMSPKKELRPRAYVERAGLVDTNHWYYYENYTGTLTGLEDFAGVEYGFTKFMASFQIGVGANGKNLDWGGAGWLDATLQAAPPNANVPAQLIGDINVSLVGQENECAQPANALVGVGQLGGHALYLNGIGSDFVFQPGGQFSENADGTATLTGVLERVTDSSQRFLVSAQFSGRLDAADFGYPPPMSPKMELVPSVYQSNGGAPIDTNTWHYYTDMTGTLLGQGIFAGALYSLSPMGPAFQVGVGANGKNLNHGGSGWLNVFQQAPASNPNVLLPLTTGGDINIDLSDECPTCAEKATADTTATWTQGGHAIYLGSVMRALVFLPGAVFEEFDDGSAHLTGIARGERAPNRRFEVDIWFSGRVNPGDPGYAPPMSPKKELYPAMYVENGGVVDADTWHYYRFMDGFLTGQLVMAGALLKIEPMGPAFQVGLGANGKNLDFGGAGWMNVTTLSQPANGPYLPLGFGGDINLVTQCP